MKTQNFLNMLIVFFMLYLYYKCNYLSKIVYNAYNCYIFLCADFFTDLFQSIDLYNWVDKILPFYIFINFQSHWKFCLVLLICDAVTRLLRPSTHNVEKAWPQDNVLYSALEIDLYWNFCLAAIGMLKCASWFLQSSKLR